MKENKPFSYYVGYTVGATFIVCIAVCAILLMLSLTGKFILWLF